MYSATQLKEQLQDMDLVAFTTPAPDKLLFTVVATDTNTTMRALPLGAKAYVEELLTDTAVVVSMTSIKVPDTNASGWTIEVLIPPAGAVVAPIKDGE